LTFSHGLPLLLSFMIGALIGVLAAGLLPATSRTVTRASIQNWGDSLFWLLMLAAFAFGVLVTFALSVLP